LHVRIGGSGTFDRQTDVCAPGAKLRAALLEAQYDLFQNGRFPVIVPRRREWTAREKARPSNLLNEWMDPRHIRTVAFEPRPTRSGEASADVALLAGTAGEGKDRHPVRPLVMRNRSWNASNTRPQACATVQRIEGIVRFEQMLADEGALGAENSGSTCPKRRRKNA